MSSSCGCGTNDAEVDELAVIERSEVLIQRLRVARASKSSSLIDTAFTNACVALSEQDSSGMQAVMTIASFFDNLSIQQAEEQSNKSSTKQSSDSLSQTSIHTPDNSSEHSIDAQGHAASMTSDSRTVSEILAQLNAASVQSLMIDTCIHLLTWNCTGKVLALVVEECEGDIARLISQLTDAAKASQLADRINQRVLFFNSFPGHDHLSLMKLISQ